MKSTVDKTAAGNSMKAKSVLSGISKFIALVDVINVLLNCHFR